MTPSQIKKYTFPPKKNDKFLGGEGGGGGVFRTPSGLVLSKNSIVISLVQVPCSFYWTI